MLSFPPDWTFLAQIIIFVIVWTCLRKLLFEPNLSVLRTRQQRTTGATNDAAAVNTEAVTLDNQYKESLSAARAEARSRVEAIYKDAEDQAKSVVDAARKDAELSFLGIRGTLREETEQTQNTLRQQVDEFAREISEKLLERPIPKP